MNGREVDATSGSGGFNVAWTELMYSGEIEATSAEHTIHDCLRDEQQDQWEAGVIDATNGREVDATSRRGGFSVA
jgi:hypothetical protein